MVPDVCLNCGAEVPTHAKACPECGSDERTGWSDSARADRLGVPDEEFDYDDFVKEEFGNEPKPRGVSWLWWVAALLLVLMFLFFSLGDLAAFFCNSSLP